jgi:hypothetical protein
MGNSINTLVANDERAFIKMLTLRTYWKVVKITVTNGQSMKLEVGKNFVTGYKFVNQRQAVGLFCT